MYLIQHIPQSKYTLRTMTNIDLPKNDVFYFFKKIIDSNEFRMLRFLLDGSVIHLNRNRRSVVLALYKKACTDLNACMRSYYEI
jgi:hypothetical protein